MKLISQYCKRLSNAVKTKGVLKILKLVAFSIIAVPIAGIIILISPFIKIRLISLYTSRIGEYALNNYFILCALDSNDYPEEKGCKHFFYSYSDVPICNDFFHKMCSRVLWVLPCGTLWSIVDRILGYVLKDTYNTRFKRIYESSGGDENRWKYFKEAKQFFKFTENEIELGKKLQNQLGIPIEKPFICLLVRDSKYLQTHLPDTDDWKYHEYRNANIENYTSAIEYLTEQGFYVVRMGKHVDNSLDINNKKFIDYANHPLRSDFMDIYLSAHCFFFVSTNCGIDAIAQVFNRPVVTTNSIFCDISSYLRWSLTIPKNVMNLDTKSFVSYSDQYKDFEHFFLSGKCVGLDPRRCMFQEWQIKKWAFVENSSEEILFVIKEMLDFLRKNNIETEKSTELQRLFWNSFPIDCSKYFEKLDMYISPSFLSKYSELFSIKPIDSRCELIQ